MSPEQIRNTATLMVEQCWRFRYDDIDLAFRNGLAGKYGEIYDRMDGSVLFSWINKYDLERTEESRRMKKEQLETNNITHVLMHPQVKQITDDVLGKIEAKDKLRMEEVPKVKRERTPEQDFVDWCYNEFNHRHKNQMQQETKFGPQIITAYGRQFTIETWLEHKVIQYQRVRIVQQILNAAQND